MSGDVWMTIKAMLADYVGVPADGFEMEKSLDLAYDMDSTELTEVAKKVEVEFSLSVDKSMRSSWESGADIAAFVCEQTRAQQLLADR